MTSCAWLWVYAGLFLMLLELVTPGFILCFFGLSAISVGVLRFVFGEAFDASWQLAAFSVFAVLYIALLRRYLKRTFLGAKVENGTDFDHESIGRVGKVVEAIEPPRTGRVVIGDSEWTASASSAIPVGADVKVTAQQNLTMTVEAI